MRRKTVPRRAPLAAAVMLALTGPVQAATIDVGPSCSIDAAVLSANNDSQFDDCTAGSGADLIRLPQQSVFPNGTLTITDDVEIAGFGPMSSIDTEASSRTMTIGDELNSPNVTLRDLRFVVGEAGGGTGNGGGGGALGAGGAIFVYDGSVAAFGVTFFRNWTGGGAGSSPAVVGPGGGGAGMGFAHGGVPGAAGAGGFGVSAFGGEFGGGGGGGGDNTCPGGFSGGGGGGGVAGGGGGVAGGAGPRDGEFGGGGGGGGAATEGSVAQSGASGGFAGGGGGGGSTRCASGVASGAGGSGGFGGGGGGGGGTFESSAGGSGGLGGFGAGGGGGGRAQSGTGAPGAAGFGGGAGGGFAGGGGGAFGGAIFVRSGRFFVATSTFEENIATAGAGGGGTAAAGLAKGGALAALTSLTSPNGNDAGYPSELPVVRGCANAFTNNVAANAGTTDLDNVHTFGASLTQLSGPCAAQMVVTFNSEDVIANGDVTPSPDDGTDFEDVDADSGFKDLGYRVENRGTAAFNLTGTPRVAIGGPNAPEFTVTVVPTTPIGVFGESDVFIRFDPSGAGLRRATVTIANDTTANPYTFAIQGTGVSADFLFDDGFE